MEGLRGWREEIEYSRLEGEVFARAKGQRQDGSQQFWEPGRLAWLDCQGKISRKRHLWNALNVQA